MVAYNNEVVDLSAEREKDQELGGEPSSPYAACVYRSLQTRDLIEVYDSLLNVDAIPPVDLIAELEARGIITETN